MSEETNEQEGSGDKAAAASAAAALEADRKAFETETEAASKALIAALPESLRALVPDNLSPAQKISWAAKALKSGVAKTDSKPQTGTRDAEMSRLPPTARIAAGYGKK